MHCSRLQVVAAATRPARTRARSAALALGWAPPAAVLCPASSAAQTMPQVCQVGSDRIWGCSLWAFCQQVSMSNSKPVP